MKKKLLALFLVLALALTGCAPAVTSSEESSSDVVSDASSQETSSEETSSEPEQEVEVVESEKHVIVYFANWNLDSKAADAGGEVVSIPWEDVTYVNHAFWAVAPNDGTTETTLEWKAAGNAPRTDWTIVSTSPEADYENTELSEILEGVEKNHFAEYAAMSEKYPDVNIVISIGGWSACGYFSEMAYTQEGRATLIQSCMDLMERYPWIDGFDFDWEYFGGSGEGEGRLPESEDDQGCPIWGLSAEDSVNFAALLKELRAAIKEAYGDENAKLLTACASSSTSWTLPCQNWSIVHEYLDMVNVMTYDGTGTWDTGALHQSTVTQAENAVFALHAGHGIPYEKLCIGSPMYGIDLQLIDAPGREDLACGAAIESFRPAANSDGITQEKIRGWIAEAEYGFNIEWVDGKPQMGETFDSGEVGWHNYYDASRKGVCIFNDDPDSEYYKWYISYENEITLQQKLDYINRMQLGGIIVWESSQDTYEHDLIGQMADNLLK